MMRFIFWVALGLPIFFVRGQDYRFLKYYSMYDDTDQGEAIRFLADSMLVIGTTSIFFDEKLQIHAGFGIFNLSKTGDINFTQIFENQGESHTLYYQRIIPIENGDFICGSTFNNVTENMSNDYEIIKFSGNGDILWSKNWGNQSYEQVSALCRMPNGNIAMTGITNEFDPDYDISVFILDSLGNILHSKIYGWEGRESVKSICALSDTTLILGGSSLNIDPDNENEGILLRLNAEGDSLYSVKYYGYPRHGICSIKLSNDDLILVSVTDSISIPGGYEYTSYFSKQDEFGVPEWKHFILRPELLAIWDFQIDKDQNILFTGDDHNLPEDIDLYTEYDRSYVGFVGKLDAMGDSIWFRQYVFTDGVFEDNFHALTTDAAGYVYVTGFTDQEMPEDGDLRVQTFLLRLDPDGCFEPGCTDSVLYLRRDSTYIVGIDTISAIQHPFVHQSYFSISPNPVIDNNLTIRFYNIIDKTAIIRIYDAQARVIKEYYVAAGTKEYRIDGIDALVSGIYYVSYLRDGIIKETRRVVINE